VRDLESWQRLKLQTVFRTEARFGAVTLSKRRRGELARSAWLPCMTFDAGARAVTSIFREYNREIERRVRKAAAEARRKKKIEE